MAAIPAFRLGNLGSPTLQPLAVSVIVTNDTVRLPAKPSGMSFIPSPVLEAAGGGGGGDCDAVGFAG